MARPVFIFNKAEPWAKESLVSEWIMAILSICLERWGSASDTTTPIDHAAEMSADWPAERLSYGCFVEFIVDALSIPLAVILVCNQTGRAGKDLHT